MVSLSSTVDRAIVGSLDVACSLLSPQPDYPAEVLRGGVGAARSVPRVWVAGRNAVWVSGPRADSGLEATVAVI